MSARLFNTTNGSSGAYPGFCSIKQLGALLTLNGMLVHCRLPPSYQHWNILIQIIHLTVFNGWNVPNECF
jgi:hypothetical protein